MLADVQGTVPVANIPTALSGETIHSFYYKCEHFLMTNLNPDKKQRWGSSSAPYLFQGRQSAGGPWLERGSERVCPEEPRERAAP